MRGGRRARDCHTGADAGGEILGLGGLVGGRLRRLSGAGQRGRELLGLGSFMLLDFDFGLVGGSTGHN